MLTMAHVILNSLVHVVGIRYRLYCEVANLVSEAKLRNLLVSVTKNFVYNKMLTMF